MNRTTTCDPAEEQETRASRHEASGTSCTLIIMVESGVVTDILPTGPMEAVVVALDMLENADSFEQRMRKSVLQMNPEGRSTIDAMPSLITSIVREYRRPGRRRAPDSSGGPVAA